MICALPPSSDGAEKSIPTATEFDRLWDYGDPPGSETRFRALLAGDAARWPAPARLELQTQIARAQGLQRQFAAAHSSLDEVERSLAALATGPGQGGAEPVRRARARLLLERGRVFNSSGDPATARPIFEEAFAVSRGDALADLAVDAAHMVAIVAPADEAMQWNLKAIALAGQSPMPSARKWRASLLNNTGWTHHDEGRYQQALDSFQEALSAREEREDVGPIRVARWCVARTLRSLGRWDEALAAQQALAAEHEASGTSDGYVQEELAELLLALDRADEAAPHCARAFELLAADPWMKDNEGPRLERLKSLAGL